MSALIDALINGRAVVSRSTRVPSKKTDAPARDKSTDVEVEALCVFPFSNKPEVFHFPFFLFISPGERAHVSERRGWILNDRSAYVRVSVCVYACVCSHGQIIALFSGLHR